MTDRSLIFICGLSDSIFLLRLVLISLRIILSCEDPGLKSCMSGISCSILSDSFLYMHKNSLISESMLQPSEYSL